MDFMSSKRQVSIREFLGDFRSGMMDYELMRKYRLSSKGLQSAFQKLTNVGALTWNEIDNRPNSGDHTIFFRSTRIAARRHLVIPVPIYEMGSYPESVGRVRDVTEQGLGISGIDAEVGDMKAFSIFPNEFVTVESFSFKAECRWIEKRVPGDMFGGFYITEISNESMEKLRRLIRELKLGDH